MVIRPLSNEVNQMVLSIIAKENLTNWQETFVEFTILADKLEEENHPEIGKIRLELRKKKNRIKFRDILEMIGVRECPRHVYNEDDDDDDDDNCLRCGGSNFVFISPVCTPKQWKTIFKAEKDRQNEAEEREQYERLKAKFERS